MHDPQRDVPRSLIRAGIIAVIAYAIPITVILFTLPKDQLSNAGGFVKAFQVVAGVLPGGVAAVLGWLIAVGIVIALASSGGTWIIGADPTYAIAALDRNAPVILGRFSGRYGAPIGGNTIPGIVTTLPLTPPLTLSPLSPSPPLPP